MIVIDAEDWSMVAAQELLARIGHSYTGKLHEMLPRFNTISFMIVVSWHLWSAICLEAWHISKDKVKKNQRVCS